MSAGPVSAEPSTSSLLELAAIFLRLGCTAFGGPAAHIALMQQEFVGQRRWLTNAEFLDLLGATNLIPGPNSTEMAIHIGLRRCGLPGLLIAGGCFIAPAAMLAGLIGWLYLKAGKLPAALSIFQTIQPVMLVVILQAMLALGRGMLQGPRIWILVLIATGLSFAGINELAVLGLTSLTAVLWPKNPDVARAAAAVVPSGIAAPSLGAVAAGAMAYSSKTLFWFFFKTGSILFGSGYVLMAYLQNGLVDKFHWLTQQQLLDAIAVGQFTPGPVLTTSTFIGYILGGTMGAIAATVGIFLPAFVFVALSGPIIPRLRSWPAAGRVLDGLNAASFALLGVVLANLSANTLQSRESILILLLSGFLLLRLRLNSVWLILAAGIWGAIRHLVI
jgi:chromate transporter